MASLCFESQSSSSTYGWTYDVFLSFRGPDTRKNFTDHLYSALDQAGIYTFRDDNEIPLGGEISPHLLQAIQESRISIVAFSKSYASSRWCLDELVKILECKRTTGQLVLPIFYDIDPSDIRIVKWNSYEVFDSHEEAFKIEMEKTKRWREALEEAKSLSGWTLKDMANGYESKFIQKIVEHVLQKLGPNYLDVAKYPVGIESRVNSIIHLLNIDSNDVRVVGICGMPGVGKTTIAKAIFNQLCHRVEGSLFISNVKEKTEEQLQEQLLCDLLKQNNWKVENASKGVNLMRDRFHHKRVLIILDDVDQLKQLDALVRERNGFGAGSRIIITTRDEHLLTQFEVDGKYHVKELHQHESLQLFSLHAFRSTHPEREYMELSSAIVDYAGGVPLALEVLGSHLFKRNISVWRSAVKKLGEIPNQHIQKKLRISFDTLDDDKVKGLFLDIACFFIGWDKEYIAEILHGRGFFPEIGFDILIQRSLLTVNHQNELHMHDLLRDMGREISREVSYNHPGKRNRIWLLQDALDVLNKQTGTDSVEGLALDVRASKLSLSTKSFSSMRHLKLLQVNGAHLAGSYRLLPKELIWLCWLECPMKSLPTDFQLNHLVVLDLQHSNIKELWKETKILNKLKILNLSYSKYLVKTPNFSGLSSLERLILTACTSLVKVHRSIGHLKSLVLLNLEGCCRLQTLPESICCLKSLETLNISMCSHLEKLPECLGDMESLIELLANGTEIKQLPLSIGYLKKLTKLSLGAYSIYEHDIQSKSWFPRFSLWLSRQRRSSSVAVLPTSFTGLSSLKELDISYCGLSEGISSIDLGSLSYLEKLNLSGNNFSNLPAGIGRLPKLVDLWVRRCSNLILSTSDLPSSLLRLYSCRCSSMKQARLPIQGKKRPIRTALGCLSLIEFQSMEFVGNSTSILNLEDGNNLSNNSKKSLTQGLCNSEMYEISFSGGEIPEWFSHRGEGSSLSFHLPSPGSDGNQLQAMLIWIVYDASLKGSFAASETILRKKSNGTVLFERPTITTFDTSTSTKHSWILNIPLIGDYRCAMIGVEELELNVNISSSVIEKCGVHLIMEQNNADSDIPRQFRTDSMIPPSQQHHHRPLPSSSTNERLESSLIRELQKRQISSVIKVPLGMTFTN